MKTLLFVSFNSGSQKANGFVFGDAFTILPDATLVFTCTSVSSKSLRRFGAPTKTPKYLLIPSGGTYFEMLRVLKHFGYTDLQHDQKPISHFYVAVVTCVLARFS